MPRGPRFAFENSFLHVFNRGINRQSIFFSPADYIFFLKKLLEIKRKYDHSIYALCLMPDHFHISIQTRKVSISKIMSSLTTSYSMYFNRNHHHLGPVFQNRFKSILIENDNYFIALSRYIYLNPVKSGLVEDPQLYPYSSFNEAIGKEPLKFLDVDIVRLIGETKQSQENYQKFVYEGLTENLDQFESLFTKEEVVLGSTQFASRAMRKYLRRKHS